LYYPGFCLLLSSAFTALSWIVPFKMAVHWTCGISMPTQHRSNKSSHLYLYSAFYSTPLLTIVLFVSKQLHTNNMKIIQQVCF